MGLGEECFQQHHRPQLRFGSAEKLSELLLRLSFELFRFGGDVSFVIVQSLPRAEADQRDCRSRQSTVSTVSYCVFVAFDSPVCRTCVAGMSESTKDASQIRTYIDTSLLFSVPPAS